MGHSYECPKLFVIISPRFAACQYAIRQYIRFLPFVQVYICRFMQYCVLKIAKVRGMIKAQRRDLLFKSFLNSSVHIKLRRQTYEMPSEAFKPKKAYIPQKERLRK